MTFDKYIANFVTRIQCYKLWHMVHPTLKKTLQNIDITVSLYVLAELIEEDIYTIILSSSTSGNCVAQEMILK